MAELVHSIQRGRAAPAGRGPPARARTTTSWSWASAAGGPPRRPGSSTIPAIVRETDDNDMLRDALLENLHRSQLNPLEEAAAYEQLLEDFGCTHEELASRIGRSRPQISNTLRLLKLAPAVQRRVAAGVLSAGHARSLLGVEDPDAPGPAGASGWSPRASACAASRRSSRSATPASPAPAGGPRASPTAPGLADLADRLSDRLRDPGQGRPRPEPRARSPSSSRSSTTCSGSSTSWTRATATTGRSEPQQLDLRRQSGIVDLSTSRLLSTCLASPLGPRGALAPRRPARRASSSVGALPPYDAGSHQEPGGCSSAG